MSGSERPRWALAPQDGQEGATVRRGRGRWHTPSAGRGGSGPAGGAERLTEAGIQLGLRYEMNDHEDSESLLLEESVNTDLLVGDRWAITIRCKRDKDQLR